MKKPIILTILLLIISGFVIVLKFTPYANLSLNFSKPVYSYVNKPVTQTLPNLKVDGYYPYIENVRPEINTSIKKSIDSLIAEKSKDVTETLKAIKETGGRTSDMVGQISLETITPTELDPDTISFLMRATGYTGGAHGFLYYIPFNFEAKTGLPLNRDQILTLKKIKLDNLASVARPILKKEMERKLGEYSKELSNEEGEEGLTALRKNIVKIDDTMFNEGTDVKKENYLNILLGKNSFDIYFEPYAVASWAEGEFIITIPFSQFPNPN